MRSAALPVAELKDKTWVTRKGIYVDRIASAWFVRRFVDSGALFKFVPAKGYKPLSGEVRFDMFEAEFTHEGDRCTLEILIDRTGINDPALVRIAEVVHDIDLKDGKFGAPGSHAGELPSLRADASGVARFSLEDHSISLTPGATNSVIGRALVVHRDPDDFTTQPAGNSGPRIACAVIGKP